MLVLSGVIIIIATPIVLYDHICIVILTCIYWEYCLHTSVINRTIGSMLIEQYAHCIHLRASDEGLNFSPELEPIFTL